MTTTNQDRGSTRIPLGENMMRNAKLATSRIVSSSLRTALTDLNNHAPLRTTRSQAAKKIGSVTATKTVVAEIKKPVRTLTKQKASTALPKIIQEVEPMELATPSIIEPFSYSSSVVLHDDIDKEDTDNPQLVVAYVNDIYAYLRQLEKQQSVNENYLANNVNILPKMRAVLIDWLVDVHQQFNLLQETLYLTVSIIDRFLQVAASSINRKLLQLVGVSAMFIASKYEEMYAPEIGDFIYITDNSYTQAQILSMEIKIMRAIDFQFGRPLPLHFLRRNSKAGFVDARIHALAKYVMELSIIDYKFAHILPSMLAAAALAFSIKILNDRNDDCFWTSTLTHYSAYTLETIAPLIKDLAKMVQKVTLAPSDAKLMAVRKKYSDKKMLKIALIPQLTSTAASDLVEGKF